LLGSGADSEEKREPVSDIDIAVADSLKVLDLKRPIREATYLLRGNEMTRRAQKQPLVARRLVGWSICYALRPHKGHLTSKASLRSPPRDALGEAR
jgi:hypothetical protein